MNGDQKLVASLGLGLLVLVVFTTYRAYLSRVFLGSPSGSSLSGGSSGASGISPNPYTGLLPASLNPVNSLPNAFKSLLVQPTTQSGSANASKLSANPASSTVLV